MDTTSSPTPERLMQLAWGYAPPLIIQAAVECHLFDHIDAGARTLQEPASARGASERGLREIPDALVGLHFLTRSGNAYALTAESSSFLLSKKPAYYGEFFR